MADDAPLPAATPPTPAAPASAAVAKVEGKIDAVAAEIKATPDEDKDKEWREGLASTLAEITTQLKDLKTAQGESAEVSALRQEVSDLLAELRTRPASPLSPSAVEGAPPSPATPPAPSSETPPVAEKKDPPVAAKKPAKEPRKKVWV